MEGIHLDYYVGNIREDVFGNVLKLFAETCSIPSIIHEVGLFFLWATIDTIIIDQFLPQKKCFIIRIIANEVGKKEILNLLYKIHIKR